MVLLTIVHICENMIALNTSISISHHDIPKNITQLAIRNNLPENMHTCRYDLDEITNQLITHSRIQQTTGDNNRFKVQFIRSYTMQDCLPIVCDSNCRQH